MYRKKTVTINGEKLRVCPECGSSHLCLREATQAERTYTVAGVPAYQEGVLNVLACSDCGWNTGTKLTTSWISHFTNDWNTRCRIMREREARKAAGQLCKTDSDTIS